MITCKIGNIAILTIEIIEPLKKDPNKQEFSYDMFFCNPENAIGSKTKDKIATLIYLYINKHQPISANDIVNSIFHNKRGNLYPQAVNMSFERLLKKYPEWNEFIKRPLRSDGLIICNMEISSDDDSVSDFQTKSPSENETKITKAPLCTDDIWIAGKQSYEEIKARAHGGFLSAPKYSILPLANFGSLPINVSVDEKTDRPLLEVIDNSFDHLYIVGEGGIGKTTSLLRIMRDAYDKKGKNDNNPIPLFIELSKAYNTEDFDSRGSSFYIRNTIQKQLQDCFDNREITRDDIERLFKKKTNQPEFTLLLDGLNEVSRDTINNHEILSMVAAEIRHIMSNYKNARVIITSRSAEELNNNATALYLSGISQQTIIDYLQDKFSEERSDERIEKIKRNKQLLGLLRIPLFLIIYSKIEEDNDLLSRGEILNAYYSQTRHDLYSEITRAKTIKRELIDNYGIDDNNSNTIPSILIFLLDFIIPEIAWKMVKAHKNHISFQEIKDSVCDTLSDTPDNMYCGEYGKQCFCDYPKYPRENTLKVAKTIRRILGEGDVDDFDIIAINVCDCLTMRLGIFIKNQNNEYNVIHQHIRDYFAAAYHINLLRLAVHADEIENDNEFARKCLFEWTITPLPSHLLMYIGESLGETHNSPKYDKTTKEWEYIVPDSQKQCNRNLIKRGLDIFRDPEQVFDRKDGYSVWNLIQILKYTRKDLSGENFDSLNLTTCEFNGHFLGRFEGNLAASFKGALVSDNSFMPKGHGSVVNSAFFSPLTGNYIATASGDRSAKIWDSKTYQEIGTLKGHANVLYSACFSPNEEYIITASRDGSSKIWNIKTLQEEQSFSFNTAVCAATFNSDGSKAAMSLRDGTIHIYDLTSNMEPVSERIVRIDPIETDTTSQPKYNEVNSVRFSNLSKNNDEYLIVSINDHTARIIDVNEYREVGDPLLHNSKVLYAEFDKEAKKIITACEDGSINIWNAKTRKKESNTNSKNQMKHNDSAFFAVFSPDGKYIASTSSDGFILIWDSNSYTLIKSLDYNDISVNSIQYSSDGKTIIASFEDHTFKVFDAITFEELTSGIEMGKKYSVYSAEFSPNEKEVAIAKANNNIDLWIKNQYDKFSFANSVEGHRSSVYSTQFNPQGTCIISSSSDRKIIISDLNTNMTLKQQYTIPNAHGGSINSVQWDPSKNNRFISSSADGTVKIWDASALDKVKQIGKPLVHKNPVSSASYSRNGKYIVTASGCNAIVWDSKTHNTVTNDRIMKHNKTVSSAVFSQDGAHILTASGDYSVKEWNAVSGNYELENEYHMDDAVTDVQCYEKYVIAASTSGVIKIWHSSKPEKEKLLSPKHIGAVRTVRFSENGNYIISSSDDGVSVVWSVDHCKPDNDVDCLNINWIDTIGDIPGIHLEGVDLSEISTESNLSDIVKIYLEANGAKMNKPTIKNQPTKTLRKRR